MRSWIKSLVLPPFALLATPEDGGGLVPPVSDPFSPYEYGTKPLEETLFFGLAQDTVQTTAALLFLLDWKAEQRDAPGTVGLLVLSGVAEFGWKVLQWDLLGTPSWWTVLSSGLLAPGAELSVEYRSAARFEQFIGSRTPPPYRFGLALFPDGRVVIAFRSAWYFVGEQVVPDGQKPKVTFGAMTEWHAASRWPR